MKLRVKAFVIAVMLSLSSVAQATCIYIGKDDCEKAKKRAQSLILSGGLACHLGVAVISKIKHIRSVTCFDDTDTIFTIEISGGQMYLRYSKP